MEFKTFIQSTVESLFQPSVAQHLVTAPALAAFKIAFTCAGRGERHEDLALPHPKSGSYEVYEQIGDSVLKVFMTTYFYRRFPQLWESDTGVKITARLIIKYGSKEILAELARMLGFEPHICFAGDEVSPQRRTATLEDVFEAFVGATAVILDTAYGTVGMGTVACFGMLERIYDRLDVSLAYDHLFDAKTRLKELVDFFKEKMGAVTYSSRREDNKNCVEIAWTPAGSEERQLIGAAARNLKTRAEQEAAESALQFLKARGFEKQIPEEYANLTTSAPR